MGPLSTMIVVGWDGVRKAWEMRFGQFDRVTISLAEAHVHSNGRVAWVARLTPLGSKCIDLFHDMIAVICR